MKFCEVISFRALKIEITIRVQSSGSNVQQKAKFSQQLLKQICLKMSTTNNKQDLKDKYFSFTNKKNSFQFIEKIYDNNQVGGGVNQDCRILLALFWNHSPNILIIMTIIKTGILMIIMIIINCNIVIIKIIKTGILIIIMIIKTDATFT